MASVDSKLAWSLLCARLIAAVGCSRETPVEERELGGDEADMAGTDAASTDATSTDAASADAGTSRTEANSCTAAGGTCLKHGTGGCVEGSTSSCGPNSTAEDLECCTRQIQACADGKSHFIHASDYDQRCTVDTDCVPAGDGDLCHFPCAVLCTFAAISATAEAQYQADIDAVLQGPAPFCGCPFLALPRCVDGVCQTGSP